MNITTYRALYLYTELARGSKKGIEEFRHHFLLEDRTEVLCFDSLKGHPTSQCSEIACANLTRFGWDGSFVEVADAENGWPIINDNRGGNNIVTTLTFDGQYYSLPGGARPGTADEAADVLATMSSGKPARKKTSRKAPVKKTITEGDIPF